MKLRDKGRRLCACCLTYWARRFFVEGDICELCVHEALHAHEAILERYHEGGT